MSAPPAVVKGWCPGALRPMPTGDGLLARVRVSGGRLSTDQAEALAACACDCGNGTIEISSRANLQLRGVEASKLAELQSRLEALGLLDADPEAERLRNIVASPLADLDPEAILDVAPVVAALEVRLAADADLRALPAKFGFVIDAGGRWPLDEIDADVRFEAFVSVEGARFAVQLAAPHPQPLPARGGEGSSRRRSSSPPRSYGEGAGVGQVATCAADEIPEVAARLTRAFLDLAGHAPDAPRRMRALVGRDGEPAIFTAAFRHCERSEAIQGPPDEPPGMATSLYDEGESAVPRPLDCYVARAPRNDGERASPQTAVGLLPLGERVGLGAAPPFGRMRAEAFAELARAARAEGASGLRLTPWRTIVVVGLEAARAARLAQCLDGLGFIVSPDDPRLGVVACPGAPACAHAMSDTRADARRLAAALPTTGLILHVSGCSKGCARASPAPLTLVASPDGYDLVLNGRASDAPVHRGLSLAEAESLVSKYSKGRAA